MTWKGVVGAFVSFCILAWCWLVLPSTGHIHVGCGEDRRVVGHPMTMSLLPAQCLKTLCKLRLSLDFPDVTELDKAVGAAVSAMGPEVLLEAVPLGVKSRE